MNEIKFFFFIISILVVFKFGIDLVLRFSQDMPKPLVLTIPQQTLLTVTIAYIITYLRF